MSTTTLSPARPGAARRGILWMLLTTLLFVCVTGIVRHVGPAAPAVEVAFIRYGVGIVLILPILRQMMRKPPSRRAWGFFASRGVVHAMGVMLWFYAMAHIPMAEVTALSYVAPIFVAVGADASRVCADLDACLVPEDAIEEALDPAVDDVEVPDAPAEPKLH